MSDIILTTPEQLDEIVQQALKKVLPAFREDKPLKVSDNCTFSQALLFLAENGYELSKSKLYKLTSLKGIPFRYFGRKIVFSRTELLNWVESQTINSSNTAQTLLALAESARRKTKK